MFNKQLQLELELERLRASICEPVVSQEAGSEVSTVLESPPRNLSQPMQFTHVLPTIQNSKETPLKMTEPTIMNESTKIEPFYSPTPPNSVKIGKSSKTGQSTRNDFVGSAKVSTKTSKIDSSSNGVSTSSSKGLISQSAKVKKQPTEPTISEMEGVSSRSFGLNEEEQEIPETLEVVRSAPSNKSAKASRSARNVVSADGVSTKSRAPASAKITGQFSKATAPQLRTEEDDGFSTTEPTGAVISAPPTPAHEPVAPQWQPQQPMPQQEAQQLPSVSNDSDSASLVPMSPESFQALRIGSGISLRSGNDSAGLAQVPISSMASKPYTQQQYTPNTATAPGAMNVPFPLPTSAGAGSQMSFANTSLTGFGLGMTAYNNKYHQNSAAGGIGHSNINSNNSNMNLMNSWPHSAQSSTASYSPAAPTLPSGARLFPGVGPASYFPNKFHSEPTPPKEPKYNMFVLSSAPKVSFDSMVASEISHFQHAQAYSQYAPNIGMGMGGGLDSSIASEDLNQTGSVYKTEMSIQDQICRFAEIRSLFQMPSSTDIGDLHEQHPHQHRQQINLVKEAANAKLQESIDRHKQRLAKTRKSKPSPRSQIHKPKQPAYGAESDYFHNFETSQTPRGTISQVMPTFIPMPGTSASNCSSSSAATQGSAAGGSVVYQGAVPSMEGVSLVDSAPATAATIDRTISASVSTPLRAPLSPTTGENTTNSIPALTSATTTAPSSSASVRLSQVPSSTKQQSLPEDCSRGGTAAGGLSNGEDVGGPPGSAASSTAAAASAAVDGSNAPPATPAGVVPLTATISTAPPATAISSPVQIEPQMSIEEFQQKANK